MKPPHLPLRARLQALAKARGWPPPRRIRPTRLGYGFIALTLGVGFAALNTGNNLLYLVLGMMLSVLGVSGVLSELSINAISPSRRLPSELTAGQPAYVQLTLQNHKKRLPAVGIWLEEDSPPYLEADAGFFVYVPPGEDRSQRLSWRFDQRGRHTLKRIGVSTTWPFGLFSRSFHWDVEEEVLVYPRVERLEGARQVLEGSRGDAPIIRQGLGDEFFGLKAYVDGDDPRRIHWKTSARRGMLLVREYAAEQRERLLVRLVLTHPLPEESAYELALVKVVSWAAWHLEQGYQVAVEVPGEAVPFGTDRPQLMRILRALALSPRAGEAGELPPSSVAWPACPQVLVRVTGQDVRVEGVA